ncbi:DUF4129 domain-containing protein [Chitinispirillales bacterium ANBcel5]|uniref:DUF4129 domain-containing protein n=1 Tax=Cellulosispirillum alkaliphilum TaxID=3039283 RepID=UPI002A57693A|nr:DUF4129 domain-containing protein [Chitinispirillales bacterium ANBcel5]
MKKNKKIILSLLLLFSVLTFVISIGFKEIQLQSNDHHPFFIPQGIESNFSHTFNIGEIVQFIIMNLVSLLLILTPFILLILVFFKQWRRRIILGIILIFIVMVITWLRLQVLPSEPFPESQRRVEVTSPKEPVPLTSVIPTETQTPQWLTLVVSLFISTILIIMFSILYKYLFKKRSAQPPLNHFAEEAKDAINKIESGENLKDTILHCYRKLLHIANERHSISMEHHTTPFEFEAVLSSEGLPSSSIEKLTRLFEGERYGGYKAGQKEKRQAIECLEEIVTACQDSQNEKK